MPTVIVEFAWSTFFIAKINVLSSPPSAYLTYHSCKHHILNHILNLKDGQNLQLLAKSRKRKEHHEASKTIVSNPTCTHGLHYILIRESMAIYSYIKLFWILETRTQETTIATSVTQKTTVATSAMVCLFTFLQFIQNRPLRSFPL